MIEPNEFPVSQEAEEKSKRIVNSAFGKMVLDVRHTERITLRSDEIDWCIQKLREYGAIIYRDSTNDAAIQDYNDKFETLQLKMLANRPRERG